MFVERLGLLTLDFGIDVRQRINAGPGKFGEGNKLRALYKYLRFHKSGLFNEARKKSKIIRNGLIRNASEI